MVPNIFFYIFLTYSLKGRDAKCTNLLAENDLIVPEGLKANLSYVLITQREPDHQVTNSEMILSGYDVYFFFDFRSFDLICFDFISHKENLIIR